MITIQQFKDKHGDSVIASTIHNAEVTEGWGFLEMAKIQVEKIEHSGVVTRTNRQRDYSSSYLVDCISDRD
jgi:hypothetical protein